MKKLVNKIIILLFPYCLYFVLPFCVILASDEVFLDLDKIVDNIGKGNKYLIGLGFDETPYRYLKFKTLSALPKQDIVAIGSSRILSFRNVMFSRGNFYNAGYTVATVDDFATFLSLVPYSKLPSIIIISIDQWMFSAEYTQSTQRLLPNAFVKYNAFNFNTLISATPKVYNNIYNGTLSATAILDSYTQKLEPDIRDFSCSKVGYNARINSAGFLNDGSMYYGKQISRLLSGSRVANDYNFQDTFNRIQAGSSPFQYANDVDTVSIQKLKLFLDLCNKNNIHVIAFLPPFADKVYDEMMSCKKYRYIIELPKILMPVFKRYGYEFYDFTTIASTGSTDNEVLDGFHGSETVYMNILLKMLDAGSILNNYCDVNELRMRSESKLNRYTIYKPD